VATPTDVAAGKAKQEGADLGRACLSSTCVDPGCGRGSHTTLAEGANGRRSEPCVWRDSGSPGLALCRRPTALRAHTAPGGQGSVTMKESEVRVGSTYQWVGPSVVLVCVFVMFFSIFVLLLLLGLLVLGRVGLDPDT